MQSLSITLGVPPPVQGVIRLLYLYLCDMLYLRCYLQGSYFKPQINVY